MLSLVNAFEEIARRNGAEFHFNSAVGSIDHEKNQICGLTLENSEEIKCDAVIANADLGALTSGLFGKTVAQSFDAPKSDKQRSQSAITWSMSARTSGFDLGVHNVFFSSDYAAEFEDVFDRRRLPQEPTIYLFAPDRVAGVSGPERLFALVNAPPVQDGAAMSNREISECHQRTFEQFRLHGLALETTNAELKMSTPNDFARRFPGSAGALFGQTNHGWRASFQRQGVQTRLRGLYLAGGSIHPGPGVPMAALSGRNAARAVLKNLAST
jgi:1-hydroxycarotenoid 3,4-desaturase